MAVPSGVRPGVSAVAAGKLTAEFDLLDQLGGLLL